MLMNYRRVKAQRRMHVKKRKNLKSRRVVTGKLIICVVFHVSHIGAMTSSLELIRVATVQAVYCPANFHPVELLRTCNLSTKFTLIITPIG